MTFENKESHDDYYMVIQSNTKLDPRELETILSCSLKEVFGASITTTSVSVVGVRNDNTFLLQCHDVNSISSIRAALTFCSPPPYLLEQHQQQHDNDGDEDKEFIFAFDVLEISNNIPVDGQQHHHEEMKDSDESLEAEENRRAKERDE
eukprot:CAMPEP_0194209128 /NCGR_PEP_ID=MMETSP0156-20130528/7363_1 /TAXON_ID=33649 /ORGANISM="Thalassionema nitzschioides, Strain L26-B" /LENGTH=148 /DNA_ID=CAMNT_0038936235 /DNA_START=61 /DNA_END=508 /DNA_ORIENTATION=+